MTPRIKLIVTASALSIAAAFPASADYSIIEDSSLPSVLFIEFEGDVAVGSDGSAGTVTLGGGASSSSGGGSSSEPRVISPDGNDQSSERKSISDRVTEKLAELEAASPESLEDIVIDNEIETRVLEEADLR